MKSGKPILDEIFLVTSIKMGGVLSLHSHEWCHVNEENAIFSAVDPRSRQNLKFENLCGPLLENVKEMYLSACCTCSTIMFPHSTNDIIDLVLAAVASFVSFKS